MVGWTGTITTWNRNLIRFDMILTIFKKGKEKHQVFINADYVVKVTQLGEAECQYRGVGAVCGIKLHDGEYLTAEGSLEDIVKLM